jgi:hypothetical protein
MGSLDSHGSTGSSRCSPGYARWIRSAPLDSLAAHPAALAVFSRFSPRCAHWICSAPLDSLAAHPDTLIGFSRCSPGCARWILSFLTHMPSLNSLVSHPYALAGFSQLLWILSLLTRMRSLDSLCADASQIRSLDSLGSTGSSRCSHGCAYWILLAPLDSLAADPDTLAGFSRLHWILSAPLDLLTPHPDALAGFSWRLWILSLPHPGALAGFFWLLWILSLPNWMHSLSSLVPHDSRTRLLGCLAAHPEALAGFSACLPLSPDDLVAHDSQMRSKCILLFDVDSHIPIECCRRMLLSCRFVIHDVRLHVPFVDRQ